MELDNVDATKKMVEHGLGIAFLPYTAVRGELAAGTLSEVAIEGYDFYWSWPLFVIGTALSFGIFLMMD